MTLKQADIKILMAAHKPVDVPKSDLYLPIHVGSEAAKTVLYQPDHTGDNISDKNPYYSELTGLYWAWKNLSCEYIGLVHYRRYFSHKKYTKQATIDELILSKKEVMAYLHQAPILVPKKRRYYIETLESHYANTFDQMHLDQTREIVSEYYPEYLASYDKVMQQTWGYMFNMYIMKKTLSDQYCTWLFHILEELEERIDLEALTPFEARLLGRVSELLLNVWIDYQNQPVLEIPYVHAFKVNWMKKGISFLKAKLFNTKYTESF